VRLPSPVQPVVISPRNRPAESPERVQRVLDDWQAVAEVRAGERSA
jgi:hypothetical protein